MFDRLFSDSSPARPGGSPDRYRRRFRSRCRAGLLFVLIFGWAWSGIEDRLYEVRDDGVSMMAHARNLVEYGFIGINPSGGRVEGYSAPVQFFLYAAAYAVTGVGYAAYAKAQTMIATFLLGVPLVLFFPERKVLAVALAKPVTMSDDTTPNALQRALAVRCSGGPVRPRCATRCSPCSSAAS